MDRHTYCHPSWNSKNTKTVSPDEISTNSPSRSSFGRPTSESGEIKSPKIMTLDDFIKEKTSKRSCNSEFQIKRNKKTKTSEKTKVHADVIINIGQKKFVNGEIKTVWGKRLPISLCRNATYAQILKKVLKSGKYSIATLIVKKIMCCCIKMGVVLSSCLARLKTSSSSKNIGMS